jgi:hypothetical protein
MDTVADGGGGGLRPGDDPYNTIKELDLGVAGAAPRLVGNLPPSAFVRLPLPTKPGSATSVTRGPKILPFLAAKIAQGPATARLQVLITLREDQRLPRFPEFQAAGGELVAMAERPPTADPAGAPSASSRTALAAPMVNELRARRQARYERLRAAWTSTFGVEVLETYWLIPAMLVEMPLGRVGALAENEEIVAIEPRFADDVPPQDANANNDVQDGRARISSDPYFNAVSTIEFVGLLDSGVRFTHQLLGPRILIREDCTGASCGTGPDPTDSHWNHGTSSAAILVGNDSMGAAFRGATPFYLDSFKVYNPTTLDRAGTVRAFERALALLNRTLVAEIQSSQGETGAIVTAADAAFDTGAVVIAANGNYGPAAGTMRSPASGHKVLGVGNVDVETLAQVASQSRGPTSDGRTKPDVQAPTNTETASNASDTALRVFNGTSGATPYASAVAALYRKWLRGSGSIDPGQVYAFMILAAQRPYPFDNTTGSGLLVMPTGGVVRWGKVAVTNGNTVEVPFSVPAGRQRVEAAIWWPERESESHDDVDLELVDPSGASRSMSMGLLGVFEKVRFQASPVATGTWKIRISGTGVSSGPQDVYWAARYGN